MCKNTVTCRFPIVWRLGQNRSPILKAHQQETWHCVTWWRQIVKAIGRCYLLWEGTGTATSKIENAPWNPHKAQGSRCACLLDSGGTIWLLWVYRDPVGIKIDSVGTSTRKWPVPTLYRLMYLHILMSMRLKGGKLLPPSSEDNTCVARKCIPYFLAFILNTCARAQN